MSPISSISQISRLLRKTISQNKDSEASNLRNDGKTNSSQAQTPSSPIVSREQIKKNLASKLSALPKENLLGQEGISILVSSVVSWTFGEDTKQDPSIDSAIIEVTRIIIEDPQIKEDAARLIKSLVKS